MKVKAYQAYQKKNKCENKTQTQQQLVTDKETRGGLRRRPRRRRGKEGSEREPTASTWSSTRRGVLSSSSITALSVLIWGHTEKASAVGVGHGGRNKFIVPCSPGPCVSTASFNKPSQYSSPWIVPSGTTLAQAKEQIKTVLEELGATVAPSSDRESERRASEGSDFKGGGDLVLVASAEGWGEDMKFLIKEDDGLGGVGLVTFTISSQEGTAGSGKRGFLGLGNKLTVPDPPGCFESGCISGPPQRRYVEAIRNKLGWLPLETDEDKKWVQIMQGPFLINPEDYVSAFD